MRSRLYVALLAIMSAAGSAQASDALGLWATYEHALRGAKYIDLTHTVSPSIPVWHGFGPPKFSPATNAETGKAFAYKADQFEATHYVLTADQLGTHIDAPAHWAPEYPAMDEIPATYAVRPLVVISIVDQVHKNPGYQMSVSDILTWERAHGRIPGGSVVFVRSDWSKDWPDPALATRTQFPGTTLDALKFLHLERHILMHGHEPLDTDTTPTLVGEYWLMHHGYAQAEAVANLDKVAETGCLVSIGYNKFKGATGGYARFIAICPPNWKYGDMIGPNDAPLPKSDRVLHWDVKAGVRVR